MALIPSAIMPSLETFVLFLIALNYGAATNYYAGVGIGDITGPAAEVNMMGYANPAQTSHGIHMRQFSRAFIFASTPSSNRTVFVSLDSCWGDGGVKQEVVKELKKAYGELYTEKNVAISGTHTHSGIGGYSQYLLYDITAIGFNHQGFQALVDGIVASIHMAHKSFQPADLFINEGELLKSNINRSPTSYLRNPAEERAKYDYDVDKKMTTLKITDASGKGIGLISWFAVHCTSMNNTNEMISSDNKGYASMLFEREQNPGRMLGQGPFVAAFAQSNEGDVSPNTKGPHCLDTGKPCDPFTSTCHGKNELCVAFGPGNDMFESTQIIGRNQYNKAKELYNAPGVKLNGPVDFRHTYVEMSNQEVTLKNGTKVKTCKPSMGYSFAAGTTDGPGAFDFTQGTNTTNPFWNLVRDLIKDPTPEQIRCQAPKPILLDIGEITWPYLWSPRIVDTQLLRLGQFVIISVPGEFSTMSGRRLREAVHSVLVQGGMPSDTIVVIAGLTNEYADYITTFEEYDAQRYEAASTIYGPHTLEAYIQNYKLLAEALAQKKPSPAGPKPPNQLDKQISLLPGVIFDSAPMGKHFGSIVKDAEPSYAPGSNVTVIFVSANPRNNLKTNSTFLTVERKDKSGKWVVEFTDSFWETRFKWKITSFLLGESEAIITWEIPAEQTPGSYRIRHFGTSKSLLGKHTDFVGETRVFQVKAKTETP